MNEALYNYGFIISTRMVFENNVKHTTDEKNYIKQFKRFYDYKDCKDCIVIEYLQVFSDGISNSDLEEHKKDEINAYIEFQKRKFKLV